MNNVVDKKASSKDVNLVKCAAHHRDFLTIDPTTESEFADVTAILLDPSCSGSGVYCKRPELKAEEGGEGESERVKRLANLQAMILRHALSFPSVELVVYSTCSVFQQVIASIKCQFSSLPRGVIIISPLKTEHLPGGLMKLPSKCALKQGPAHSETDVIINCH